MVDIHELQGKAGLRLILRPNSSLSWRANLGFYGLLLAVTLLISLVLTALGFWVVLPFAGAEMLALGVGLYVVVRRCRRCEVVSVDERNLVVERGLDRPMHRWCFQRAWATVRLCPGRYRRDSSRLLIQSHGRAIEIGSFLCEAERRQVAAALDQRLTAGTR
jgi:uncharacterized membrane protein